MFLVKGKLITESISFQIEIVDLETLERVNFTSTEFPLLGIAIKLIN